MKFPDVKNKTAVVTGCSTGIGRATAAHLRAHGWRVIATARKPDDVNALTAAGFETIALDIADAASVVDAATRIADLVPGGPGALVNNAGFGQVGAIEDLSRAVMTYQFEVNVFGLQHFTNLLLPSMRRQGCGRIVNISSVLGRITLPYLGIYSASKYAVEAISDALRVELLGSGIAVSIVEPGPITTRFGENAARRASGIIDPNQTAHGEHYTQELNRRSQQTGKPEPFALPPDAVARKIRHALESPRPRRRYPVTIHAYAGAFMARFAPAALIDRIMAIRAGK